MLQAFPLDGKIVCREIADGEQAEAVDPVPRNQSRGRGSR
jgi:hypothetical protein